MYSSVFVICFMGSSLSVVGIRKRVKAFKDKQATAQLAAKLEKESELAQAGIVKRFAEQRKKPLKEHLQDFRQSLIDRGNTEHHVENNL